MTVVVKKKVLVVSFVLVLLLAVLATGIVWGKGHVPAGKVQVCHKNDKVLEIAESSLGDHVAHGDLQLPACDFNNVFHKGEDCSGVTAEQLANRDSAEGVTPACPPGTF